MAGVYSIAEVVDDSNKQPEKTIFCPLVVDENETFNRGQIKSLAAVATLIQRNGGLVFFDLDKVANYLNQYSLPKLGITYEKSI